MSRLIIGARKTPSKATEEAPVCKTCHGNGFIPARDGSSGVEFCPHVIRDMAKMDLGEEIYGALDGKHTDLFGCTRDDMIIYASWGDALPQIANVFFTMWRDMGMHVRTKIVTDKDILRANFSDVNKYPSDGEGETKRRVTDEPVHKLISEEYVLLVIRLGFLGRANSAMPGYLYEALRYRESKGVRTWIISDPKRPFDKTHFAWDQQVDEYIGERYATAHLGEDLQ